MKKTFITALMAVVFIASCTVCAYSHARPEEVGISDFSGVVSDSVKEYITEKNNLLYEATEAKIIFVTSQTTDGLDINEYTQKLYSDWSIGSIGRKNSIFVVIDTENEEYSFVRGKNIRYVLPESDVYQYMIDSFEPYFVIGSYDRAIMSLYNSLAAWYESHYNGLLLGLDHNINSYMYGIKQKDIEEKDSHLMEWIILGVCVIVLIAALKLWRDYKIKQRKDKRRRLKKKQQLDIDKTDNP